MKEVSKNSTQTNRIISMVLFQIFRERAQESSQLKMRIPDGAIGEILGFSPSDTSHWKRVKKTVLNAIHLRLLIKKMDVDERRQLMTYLTGTYQKDLSEKSIYGKCATARSFVDQARFNTNEN